MVRPAETRPQLTQRQIAVQRQPQHRDLALGQLRPTLHGYGARDAGRELGISESAVRQHLTVLRHKFGVERKADLVRLGIKFGFLERQR